MPPKRRKRRTKRCKVPGMPRRRHLVRKRKAKRSRKRRNSKTNRKRRTIKRRHRYRRKRGGDTIDNLIKLPKIQTIAEAIFLAWDKLPGNAAIIKKMVPAQLLGVLNKIARHVIKKGMGGIAEMNQQI